MTKVGSNCPVTLSYAFAPEPVPEAGYIKRWRPSLPSNGDARLRLVVGHSWATIYTFCLTVASGVGGVAPLCLLFLKFC